MYVVAALTPLLVFVLPFFVPTPPAHTVSASDLAGFNNGTAVMSAVLLSVAMLVLAWWSNGGKEAVIRHEPTFALLPKSLVGGVVAATAVLQSFAGWAILASHERNLGDAGYIIEQATVRADTARSLYTQIEFAYGPLLLLPEVWISRALGCSVGVAYFVVLVVQSALGLLMLAYLVNALPIRADLRKVAFLCLAVAAVTPHFGLNYTLFRFASPLFVYWWATRTRSPWLCAALLTAGVVLELLISPELGFATAAGVVTFGSLRALQSGWRWLVTAVLPVVVLLGLLLTLGRPYLHMASMFTRGALNLPVGPYPHVLLLLVALIWLVPRTLGRWVDLRDQRSARLLGFYVSSVAFVPAALGRCDPLHVMFNGTGLWILAVMAFDKSTRPARIAWAVCLAFVVLWDHRVNERLFQFQDMVILRRGVLDRLSPRTHEALARVLAHHNPYREYLLSRDAAHDRPLNMEELRRFVGDTPVVTPAEISPDVEAQLRQAHLYSPGFFAFWVDTMNDSTEQRIVKTVNSHEWMLLPASWQEGFLQLPRSTGFFQGLNLYYKQRKPVLYCPGALFNENTQEHWRLVWSFGSYLLYKHTDHSPGIDPAGIENDCGK